MKHLRTLRENKVKEYTWSVIIALAGSLLLTYIECTACRTNPLRYFQFTAFSFLNWVILWMINSELNDFLSAYISWIKTPIKRLTVGVVSTFGFTVAAVLLIIKIFEWLAGFRFTSYTDVVVPSLIITTFISLFFHGRGFLLQWRHSAIEAERYQKESMRATFESLKNQVNPHFLFNSLNALTNLVYEDQDKAARFIKQLSEVYRYVLDTRDRELVSIEEEVKFLESYIYLQKIRFGNKLLIDNQLADIKGFLAPLSLQMLMENAIKHNEISGERPLHISLFSSDGFLVVENSLQPRSVSGEHSSGIGLQNISKRYQFLSNKDIEIVKTETSFTVKLPVIDKLI